MTLGDYTNERCYLINPDTQERILFRDERELERFVARCPHIAVSQFAPHSYLQCRACYAVPNMTGVTK